MQMNRLPNSGGGGSGGGNPNHYANARLGVDPHFQDLDCKQILHHVQNCPVCQHVFALKTPKPLSLQAPSFLSSSSKIEIPMSTLIIFAVLIIVFFVYIVKTSRGY